jgi:uncharacterized protein (DUF58 family)
MNKGPIVERHLNTHLLPILVGIFAILYILTGYRGWLVFSIGCAGAWILAALWVRSLQRNLSIERSIHLAWATVGDSLHEQLKVINKSRLPAIWVEIIDASATLASPLRLVMDVAPRASRRRYPSHIFRQRGLYTLGPTLLRTGDPLGIYTLTLHHQHASTILVTPPVLPLAQLKIPPGGRAGDQRRQRWDLEREISDAGVRDYAPGDSLRRIHWRASAHNDALMVKQLEAATSGDWWIFVDLDSSVQAGSGLENTLELSIVLAASLAARGLKERRRVGLVLAGPKLVWLEPRQGPAHHWRILQALSMAGPGSRRFADLLAVGRPDRAATVIFITPATDTAWVAAAGRRRAGSKLALLIDPVEFGGITGGITGGTVGGNADGIAVGGQGKATATLTRSGIPYIHVPGSLLHEAYSSTSRQAPKSPGEAEAGKRYLKQSQRHFGLEDDPQARSNQERQTWQRMD